MNPSSENPILLECKELWKTYLTGGVGLEVLRGLDLQVRENEFIAITGESGCGKSTLLHLLGCLDEPTSGEIVFRATPISSLRERERDRLRNLSFGFVFQFHHLLPEFSALENAVLPGMMAGIPDHELWNRGETLLAELNLSGRSRHKPVKLSGGEQQRVAVARAMINRPAVLLMDEPTGNLDPAGSLELIALIRRQQQEKSLTIIMVTHNREIAAKTDRQYELRNGKLQPAPPTVP